MTTWIWDASALHHAAAADRLDVLLEYAKAVPSPPLQYLTTEVVAEELTSNRLWHVCEPHLRIVEPTTPAELVAVTDWLSIVSDGARSRGEATVLAWAQVHGDTVIIDDGDARKVARRRGLTVHGTLWVLGHAVRAGALTPAGADAFVENLRATGARLPRWPPGGINAWLEARGGLDP